MQNLSPLEQKIYRKLQQRLDKLPIAFPKTDSGVEIRVLRHLFTPEQAQIALNMSFLPEPATTIYRRMKRHYSDVATLQQQLEEMANHGAIASSTTKDKQIIYSLTMLAIGMFEFQVGHLTKEFLLDFEQYINEAFRDALLNEKFEQLRPVPTKGSITPELHIMPYDDLRVVLSEHRGPFLKVDCICKEGKDILGHPCKVTNEREICLIFGSAARNYADHGWGKYIERGEVFEILDRAEKDGLVVQPSNSQIPFCVCLCCGCCCEVLSNARLLEKPAQHFYSNYQAVVDREKCIGCRKCMTRCQMDAISMIEKKSSVNLDRCIGCGLCTTVCEQKAMHLEKKAQIAVPPKTASELYLNIMRTRAGNAKMMLMLIRRTLKMKVP